MVQKLEELRVYAIANAFSESVTPLLGRPHFRRDRRLWEQVSDANESIGSNISEGFEQGSDAEFVRYLFYSKGSVAEVISRLRKAKLKGYITETELTERITAADRLSRSIGSLIQYLDSCGWKDRGRHQSRLRAAATQSSVGNTSPRREKKPRD